MNIFGYKLIKVSKTPSEELINQIKDILFPQLQIKSGKDDNGKDILYHIDHSIDSNLESALEDLRCGNNDDISQRTIDKIIAKLAQVRKLLDAYAIFDKNAEYILVENDDRFGSVPPEDIKANEE